MIIKVKVYPSSSSSEVIKEDNDDRAEYKVYTTKPASNNQANKDIIKLLAKYFKVSKNCISLKKGAKSKYKILEINCD